MNWMDIEPEAFNRGAHDGAEHWPMAQAGLRGKYVKDAIPSNPYHESDAQWQAYNAGFHFAAAASKSL